MKKLFYALVVFFIIGLYVDIHTDAEARDSLTRCNGNYLQRMVVVQTIVPFMPNRKTYYFGIGNKHFDRGIEINPPFCDSRTKKWEEVRISETGCFPGGENIYPYGRKIKIIDLVWFLQPKQEPIKYTAWYEDVTEEEFHKAERVWGAMVGQSCDPEVGGRGARLLEEIILERK